MGRCRVKARIADRPQPLAALQRAARGAGEVPELAEGPGGGADTLGDTRAVSRGPSALVCVVAAKPCPLRACQATVRRQEQSTHSVALLDTFEVLLWKSDSSYANRRMWYGCLDVLTREGHAGSDRMKE